MCNLITYVGPPQPTFYRVLIFFYTAKALSLAAAYVSSLVPASHTLTNLSLIGACSTISSCVFLSFLSHPHTDSCPLRRARSLRLTAIAVDVCTASTIPVLAQAVTAKRSASPRSPSEPVLVLTHFYPPQFMGPDREEHVTCVIPDRYCEHCTYWYANKAAIRH